MTDAAIRIENLHRDFGNLKALDGLSLEVPSGEIFGFLGPNGAGKTTTIQILLGLLKPTDGHAEVLGFDTSTQSDEIRTRTGALLEHNGLYEHLTAEQNLEFYGRVWCLPQSEREERIKSLLKHMGLWDRRKDQVGTWSKGMKQKLALARVMLHRPDLVLLDEPTAGLDVMSAVAVREDLSALTNQEGTTVFLTTHNMSEAEKLCSQVAVIRKGKLVAVGHPDSLRRKASGTQLKIFGHGFTDQLLANLTTRQEVNSAELQNGHLKVELQAGGDSAPLVSLLVEAGVQVEEVRRDVANLEDVFMTLMEEEK